MNLLETLRSILLSRKQPKNVELINNILVTKDKSGNVIKREFPTGYVIKYRYDILNREREMRTSEGYVEHTDYHNTSKRKKEVRYFYKKQEWVDYITLDGEVTTEYVEEKEE